LSKKKESTSSGAEPLDCKEDREQWDSPSECDPDLLDLDGDLDAVLMPPGLYAG